MTPSSTTSGMLRTKTLVSEGPRPNGDQGDEGGGRGWTTEAIGGIHTYCTQPFTLEADACSKTKNQT